MVTSDGQTSAHRWCYSFIFGSYLFPFPSWFCFILCTLLFSKNVVFFLEPLKNVDSHWWDDCGVLDFWVISRLDVLMDWVLIKKSVLATIIFSPTPPRYWYIFSPYFASCAFSTSPRAFTSFFLLPPPYSPLFILDLCFSFLFGPTRLNIDANAAYGCGLVVHMGRFWTSYAATLLSTCP